VNEWDSHVIQIYAKEWYQNDKIPTRTLSVRKIQENREKKDVSVYVRFDT